MIDYINNPANKCRSLVIAMKRDEEWSEHQRVWIWRALTVLQRKKGSDPLDALHDECAKEDAIWQ